MKLIGYTLNFEEAHFMPENQVDNFLFWKIIDS